MVAEGYSLHDLLDYEEGVDVESFFVLYRAALKSATQRSKQLVDAMVVALGSLFDRKILREYNQGIKDAMTKLDAIDDARDGEKQSRSHRDAMVKTAQELKKLTTFLTSQ